MSPNKSLETALPVTAWKSQRIAEKWLADAEAEWETGQLLMHKLDTAGADENRATWWEVVGSVRREIVLAACFAETFLFEYVRDYVIGNADNRNFEAFRSFMLEPEGESLWNEFRIMERWKQTAQKLHLCGAFADPSQYFARSPVWTRLHTLMRYRNNLVHGNVGLPREAWESDRLYEPSPAQLADLGPGWATEVALTNAAELHRLNTRGRATPAYLSGDLNQVRPTASS